MDNRTGAENAQVAPDDADATAQAVIDSWRDARGLDRAVFWEVALHLRIAAAIREAEQRGMQKGFRLGFMATGEGYNGEYGYDPDDAEDFAYWCRMRDSAIEALATEPAADGVGSGKED